MRANNLYIVVSAAAVVVASGASTDTITHGGTSIDMALVMIGNPGNPADTRYAADGYGAVGYTYRIGKYEVSENQWDAVVAASGSDLLTDPGYWTDDQPVAQISWHEAAMFCNWLTSGDVMADAYEINASGEVAAVDRNSAASVYSAVYVIPTEDEWYKAAYYAGSGGAYYDWPTGSDTAPSAVAEGTDPDTAVYGLAFGDPEPAAVDNCGGLSPYGTMGQGGNIWEWNELDIGWARGLRGGCYTGSGAGPLHASDRCFVSPTDEVHAYGFRVAEIPEPVCAAMLALGAAVLVRRRR